MIKEFTKSLSVYGILPVLSKFLSFFFIPLYVRIFNKTDYAAIELFLNTANLFIFLINLEIYSAVGRMFNEKNEEGKINLISSGLWLTIASSVVVVIICLVFSEKILVILFNDYKYITEFYCVLIWIVLNSYLTYFSVITRFRKKDKKFVSVHLVSIILRFVSTLFFVLVLKTGIIGVLYGQIAGSLLSFIMFYNDNRIYIKLRFIAGEAKQLLKYCLPIVPGLIIAGSIEPIIRVVTMDMLSVNELADYSFAFRLAAGFAIVSQAVQMAYKPYIFEKVVTDSHVESMNRISSFFEKLIYLGGAIYILFGNELISVLGTDEYKGSVNVLGLIVWSQLIAVLTNFRELGPEIIKKTKYLSFISVGSVIILVMSLKSLGGTLGLLGVGAAITIFQYSRYYAHSFLSVKFLKMSFNVLNEFIYILTILFCIFLTIYDINISFKIIAALIIAILFSPREIRSKIPFLSLINN